MAKITQFKNGKSPGNFVIRDSEDVLNEIKTGVYTALIDTLNSLEYLASRNRVNMRRMSFIRIGLKRLNH